MNGQEIKHALAMACEAGRIKHNLRAQTIDLETDDGREVRIRFDEDGSVEGVYLLDEPEPSVRRPWEPDLIDPLLSILGSKPASTANDCQLEHALAMVALADSGKPNGIKPQDLAAYRAMAAQGTKRTCRECLTVLEPTDPVEVRAARWAARVGLKADQP